MDFLLLAVLLTWSFASTFLPFREKILRVLMVVNAVLVSLALFALSVPALGGNAVSVLNNFFIVGQLRGLLAIPLGLSWVAVVVAFTLWWGASFKLGTGIRPLFCIRSSTLVGAFIGVVVVLFTSSFSVVLLGLLVTLLMVGGGAVFQASHDTLRHVRLFMLCMGAALVTFEVGSLLLLIDGFYATENLLLTVQDISAAEGSLRTLSFVGIAIMGFASMWFMGLLPGMAWYRKGITCLPKGHRLLLRVFLPVVLFAHLLFFSTWGGALGVVFVQKMMLLFGFFVGITLVEYLRAQESIVHIFVVLLLGLSCVSLGFGPAGAIAVLMLLMMLILAGTLFFLAQGGVWWSARIKKSAATLFMGIPFLSPFFVPYALSVGYGMQMMPVVASITAVVLVGVTYILVYRLLHAWTESQPHYADIWSARLAGVLLVIMVGYGCWFMYADALSLMVDAVGGV